jgi:hypothetical protein
LSQLYGAGWEMARGVAVSLSIGSVGFVWFQQPEFVSKYYLNMHDLEAKAEIGAERTPRLAVKWHDGPFDEAMIRNANFCLALWLTSVGTRMRMALDRYQQGLALMGKSDLLLRFELNAFEEFYQALRVGLHAAGSWDGTGDGRAAFEEFISRIVKAEEDRKEYFETGESLARGERPSKEITLEEVGGMKALCDVFFIGEARKRAQELGKRREESPDGSAVVDSGPPEESGRADPLP